MNVTLPTPKYPIGTVFHTRGKRSRRCEVRDYHFTFNKAGELVSLEYIATHSFMGQHIREKFNQTSIDMSNPQPPSA